MTRFHRAAAAALVIALTAGHAFAQPATRGVRLTFKDGANEAAASGSLKGAATARYVFSAKTGETITVTLKSAQPELGFSLLAPEDHELTFQAQEYKGVAPLDGDYAVSLQFLHADSKSNPAAPYTLTVRHETIEAPEQ